MWQGHWLLWWRHRQVTVDGEDSRGGISVDSKGSPTLLNCLMYIVQAVLLQVSCQDCHRSNICQKNKDYLEHVRVLVQFIGTSCHQVWGIEDGLQKPCEQKLRTWPTWMRPTLVSTGWWGFKGSCRVVFLPYLICVQFCRVKKPDEFIRPRIDPKDRNKLQRNKLQELLRL